jgi:hypothetical protein
MEATIMRKLLLAALAAAAAVPAFAGDCADGFSCCNQCPLAQQANAHRATGREATAVSATVRAALAAQVEKNLSRI